MSQHRAVFDARVTFSNGGGLTTEGFRVDVPSSDVSPDEVAALFVRSLGLLLVADVHLDGLRIVEEPHKGTRGGPSDTTAAAGDGPTAWRHVELSHVVTAGMTTYPGLPGPEITPHLTREQSREHYAEGTTFAIDRISMVGNTGTYLDSPLHRYADGGDLASLPLERLADLPVVVVRVAGTATRAIDAVTLAPYDVRGCAVLLHTGDAARFGTPAYAEDAAFLTEDGARWLADSGAALVGIDAINIDAVVPHGARPAHSTLLAAGIPIVEHLTGLEQLPPTGARFTAAPPRVAGFGTFPVRAYARMPA